MRNRPNPSPSPIAAVLPVPETTKVLQALTPLNQAQRITVLSAAIAFFEIGNAQLNVVK